MAAPAVPTTWQTVSNFIDDAARTLGIISQESKGVKEAAKLALAGLKVFGEDPVTRNMADNAIIVIETAELPQSIAYWLNGTYKKAEETAIKIAGQVHLTAIRILVTLKGLSKANIFPAAAISNLLGKIPVVGEYITKYGNFDSLISVIYIPFAALSLVDNGKTIVDDNAKKDDAAVSTINWMNRTPEDVKNVMIGKQNKYFANPVRYKKYVEMAHRDFAGIDLTTPAGQQEIAAIRANMIQKNELKKKMANISTTKTVMGAISTVLKVSAAITALVALAVFGGVAIALTALGILGLAACTFSFAKVVYEGYQSKYQNQYKQQIAAAAA